MQAPAHPSRLHPSPPLKTDAKKAWAALKKEWQRPKWKDLIGSTEGTLRDRLEALRARSGEKPHLPEEDGLLYLVLMHPDDSDSERLRPLVDYHVCTRGPLFALQALLQYQKHHWESQADDSYALLEGEPGESHSLQNGWLHPWHRLRTHLSLASEADYQAALQYGQSCWKEATPPVQAALAYLFPDTDFASRIAEKSDFGCLIFSLRDPAQLEALVRRLPYENLAFYKEGWEDEVVATRRHLLEELGAESLPVLIHLFKEEEEDTGEVLAEVPRREALETLCAHLERMGVRENLLLAVQRHPSLAIPALAQVAISRNRTATYAKVLLSQLLRTDATSATQALPSMSDAPRRLVEGLLEKLRPPVEASPTLLPTVLQLPPWRQKKTTKKAASPQNTELQPFPVPASEQFASDAKERLAEAIRSWRADFELETETPAAFAELALDDLGINVSYASLLERNDPEKWEKLAKELGDCEWGYPLACVQAPDPLALFLWNHVPGEQWYGDTEDYCHAATRFGRAGLPGLRAVAKHKSVAALQFMLPFGLVDQALVAAAALKRRKDRIHAEKWLKVWPEVGAIGLIPAALGKAKKDRENGEAGLRWLARHGFLETIQSVAERYGVREGVEAILSADPALEFPAKTPSMPPFWVPAGFTRPILKNGLAMPLTAMDAIGEMLAFSPLDPPYMGIQQLRELCTEDSLEEFVWDLFSAWSFADYPKAGGWALQALGLLGGDAVARKLAPLLGQWPKEGGSVRAIAALDVLEAIGSDVALMHLHGIAQKSRFRGLQEAAQQKVQSIAESRGLTAEELEDRLVPNPGLDEHGTLSLDFGPRQFTVVFDEVLRPTVRDADGHPLKTFPRPNKSDDAEKAAEATETWKALQKDVKTLASQQLSRLERAMCEGRRWTPEVFQLFLAGHPLLGNLVRRLWWGAWKEGQLGALFRVAEDGTYADLDDAALELAQDSQIGVVHAFDLGPDQEAAMTGILSDYNILQPFRQLGREVFRLDPSERASTELLRFVGKKTLAVRLLGLENRGWKRGDAEDGGMATCIYRPISPTRVVRVEIDPGIIVGMIEEYPEQTFGKLVVSGRRAWGSDGTPLSTVPPVFMSEILRDLVSVGG